jgi:hypothetical protein
MFAVEHWLVETARSAGPPSLADLNGYRHTLSADAVRKIRRDHGYSSKERARGNLPVTEDDLRAIPGILRTPDAVSFGSRTRAGLEAIGYAKRNRSEMLILVEEVRTGRENLNVVTMWKRPAATDVRSTGDALRLYVRNDPRADANVVLSPARRKGR